MQTPYTPESLLELALAREKVYLELAEAFGPGTLHEGRNTARMQMDQALQCARWMEANGLKELMHVGPFLSAPFAGDRRSLARFRYQKVRVRAGAVIRSLHPSQGGLITTQRARVVQLHDIYAGFVDLSYFRQAANAASAQHDRKSVRQPEAVWSGTGGYWCHADLNDIELVDASLAAASVSELSAVS